MERLDVVIPYKDNGSEELRYALRSIENNLPHRNVYIIGDKPDWITNVTHIPMRQLSRKYTAVRNNIDIACHDKHISNDFILSNDDFFILRPIKHLNYHRGLVTEMMRYYGGVYYRGMQETRRLLKLSGIDEPLSYELHIPMIINKQKKIEASRLRSKRTQKNIHLRTYYGNLYNVGGRKIKDVKVYNDKQKLPKGSFMSTTEQTFNGKAGEYIKQQFPNPSKYELPN